jgi:nucleoside-diphosphate-sugar epimerase
VKEKKYLITGGTGFIGSALVRRLLDNKHFVRVFDNNSRGVLNRLSDIRDRFEFVEADIRDANELKNAAKGIDSVIHLAYVNGTEYFYSQPTLVLDIAIRGMLSVIDACISAGVRELVLASSSEVYQTPPVVPTSEEVPLTIPNVLNPRYSYGGGKLACELMAINYGRMHFDRVMIFRPHNVYGPDMGKEHVLPQFVDRAVKAIALTPSGLVNFPIQGDGTQTRAFVHIEDLTSGVMCMLKLGENRGIYHIGNPEEITVREVVNSIFSLLGREPRIIGGPLSMGSPERRCPDISRIRSIGYEPRISFTKGLPSLVNWYSKRVICD